MSALHPAWPEPEQWEGPEYELRSAFDARPTFATAAAVSVPTDPFTFDDIERVTEYYFESDGMGGDGGVWKPGKRIGTELTMILVGRLRDGRWFSCTAWNDYTGWGCQDGADFRIGATSAEVHEFGLTDSERNRLAIVVPEAQARAGEIEGGAL